jgi:hypothetical protein
VRRLDHPEAVERPAERVDHAPDQFLADRHRDELAGALDLVALLDAQVVAEDDHADRALLQVEDLAEGAVREGEQLGRHRVAEAVDPGDAVAHLEHPADLGQLDVALVLPDLFGDDRRDLVDSESHGAWTPR